MSDAAKETVSERIEEAIEAAEKIVRNPFIKTLARFGFYTKGFLFIVIGILGIMAAFGEKGGRLADPTGALTAIAQVTFGKILLVIFIVGAFGHGAWNILRGTADVDDAGKGWQGIVKRIFAVGIGIFYLWLAWTAWNLVLTAHVKSQNGGMQKAFVSTILAVPLGTFLVVIIGLGVIGAGVHEFYSGITGKYQENFRINELEGGKRQILNVLGYFGFVARALIFALIGYFFITAAIYYNPKVVVGMDGALLTLSHSYFGKALLLVTATGLVCHGILSFYEGKYRRVA